MVGVGAVRCHFFEIVPGREQLAPGSDDDDADAVIIARSIERGLQRLHHGDRQDVGWRIFQRQAQDRTDAIKGKELCHCRQLLDPGFCCYDQWMTGGRRVVSFMRQRDWPAALFELLIVAVGVLLGIEASNWNESRDAARRSALAADVLRQDLQDGIRVEDEAGAEVDAGLAAFDVARKRGERPAPYFYRIPGSDTPPNTAWESALQTGLANLIDPRLLFDLGFFYSERQGIGVRYSHYARFVEDQVLPWMDDPSHFYDAKGALRPEYAANMNRLREWRYFISVTVKAARCLDARFARPAVPGPSCRADYGSQFAPYPQSVKAVAR